ncbi:C40 family peptidase [Mucilaginibacter sp. Bleaf8]|uniref:C40 family peptidase n=1 Tax=Mucilaginibacter sp. Bleaf8 TaxID=2834430 RepID=UPI001BCBA8C5|nr:NlpC/P60 family protein [Mucilaginibacter sp. Bleaf8]MBS7566992.1 C40 family peptidase [Mucilaginibacter sp. Bleaf8]
MTAYSKLAYRFLISIIGGLGLLFALSAKAALPVADSAAAKKALQIINDIKRQYAPDKRTDIVNTDLTGLNPLSFHIETTTPRVIIAIRNALAGASVQAVINADTLPAKALGSKIYGVVTLSVANNRITPGNAAEMVTQMILGTPVTILQQQKGYYLVRTPDRYLSWVDESSVSAMDKAEFASWQKADKVIYTKQYGHAFTEPSDKSLPVSDLIAGNLLQVTGKKKGYFQVVFPDKRVAFVQKKDVQDFAKWRKSINPKADPILATAQTLIGVPYLWGGTSIKGVDCSGFTKTAYFLNGVILPRDASQQALVGDEVDIYEADSVSNAKCMQNLQAGDLLFFSPGAGQGKQAKITHTAIYMGHGQFIQAAGLVKVSSLDPKAANYDDYRWRRLVKARRMLTAIGQPGVTKVSDHPSYILTAQ